MYKSIKLDYSFSSMTPFLDEKTLDIHFNRLYQGYLNRLNQALEESGYDFRYTKEELVDYIDQFPLEKRDKILYNLGGVLNHERYFLLLTPIKKEMKTPFLDKIKETYGSLENFKEEFLKVALTLTGSGYTNLVLDRKKNLNIINTSNQEIPDLYGFKPLISLDLWEHAYFLKYENDKEKYIRQFFNFIDYEKVSDLYEKEIQPFKI